MAADGRAERADEALGIFVHDVHRRCQPLAGWGSVFWRSWARVIRGRLCPPSGDRTPRSSTTARRPRTRAGKQPWAGRSRGRGCTPAGFCVGCAPRRACERRAAAAGWQVALAAAKFASLWILHWTLVS